MAKLVIRYALFIAVLLLVSRWLDYSLFARILSFEVYVGILALIFTGFGIWMGLRITNPSQNASADTSPQADDFSINESTLAATGISPREYEVLLKIAEGQSNQEIAESLYISLSTVKSHVSNIYEKLQVKRRVQAIQTGKEKGLLP